MLVVGLPRCWRCLRRRFTELAGLSAHKAADELNSRNVATPRRGQMVRKEGAASAGASRNVPPDGFEGVRSTKLTDETRATGRSVIV